MKTTVIHHSADYDGLFCREIARKFLPEAELIGWDYGNPLIPFPSEGMVYVLDLSPDAFDLDAALIDNTRLIWIDHHGSAINKYSAQIPGYRIDGVAACRLAWQWFSAKDRYLKITSLTGKEDEYWFRTHYPFPTKQDFIDRKVEEPIAVRLVGEYDIWDKRDPDADMFQHGLRSREITDIGWRTMLSFQGGNYVEALLTSGEAVQYARTKENESIIKSFGFTVSFEGLTFLACNHAQFNSHLFTAGLNPEHDACLGFKWTGTQWAVSLYHAPGKEHHDLSLIASRLGGGGHKGACGFRAQSLPFLQCS